MKTTKQRDDEVTKAFWVGQKGTLMWWNHRDDEKFSREFFIKKVLWQEPQNGLKLICLLISDLRKCSKIARNRARDLLLAKNGKIRPLKCQFIQQLLQLAGSSIHVLIATFFCKHFLVFRFLCNFAVQKQRIFLGCLGVCPRWDHTRWTWYGQCRRRDEIFFSPPWYICLR